MNPLEDMMRQMMGRNDTKRLDTITAHYGVKIEDYEKWVEDMLIDFIRMKNKTKVIDKWFSKFDNDDRVKIFAYMDALMQWGKMR